MSSPDQRAHWEPEPVLVDIAREIREEGGCALLVGGWVRDRLLGFRSREADVEVFGLELAALEGLLARRGPVIAVGRSFGVLRVKGLDVDFSLPRRDSKIGPGHRGFAIRCDPGLSFAEAARRRDLTMNSIGFDPLTGEILDPHGGNRDLAAGVLRAVDPDHFTEDPLRALRVARFAARFEMRPDAELAALCRDLDLSELPAERIFEEFSKLLLEGRRPSLALQFLQATGLVHFFPELDALIGTPQDPEWHPEGDVWVHTLMVVDEAAAARAGQDDDAALMFGALCHDLGKPETTVEAGGHIRSPAHDARGVERTTAFLRRMRAPGPLVEQVAALVKHHLAPVSFIKNGASARGYRRLARQLQAAGVSLELLVRLARSDHLGRTTDEARARRFEAGDAFAARARELLVERQGPVDVVMGRHLIARGLVPGPVFGDILARCREVQDETGWSDPGQILDRVLGDTPPDRDPA